MQQFLYQYDLNPTTWVYLSSLLIIAIYFKFSRFWSIRNLDLIGLLAIAPGILMLAYRSGVDEPPAAQDSVPSTGSQETATDNPQGTPLAAEEPAASDTISVHHWGFILLFSVGFLFLVRLLMDTMMVRRPLLEPNLSAGGLAFLGLALFVFLMTNVITGRFPSDRMSGEAASNGAALAQSPENGTSSDNAEATDAAAADPLIAKENTPELLHQNAIARQPILRHFPSVPSRAFDDRSVYAGGDWKIASRILLFLSHLTIVIGLLVIGMRHFGNLSTGVAMGALYLLLPYTAQLVGRIEHVIPPAFLVAAVVFYRRPAVAGFFLTTCLAFLLCPLPLFLFPLWISFYWQRGLGRFAAGVLCGVVALCAVVFALEGPQGFMPGMLTLLGSETFGLENATGFWTESQWYWRIPVGALFLVISLAMAIWPAQKNLGTLIGCSAAVMLSAQFWYPFNGMMYVHWYLPLALLTVFRPNLENRIAIASLGQAWWTRKRDVTPQAA